MDGDFGDDVSVEAVAEVDGVDVIAIGKNSNGSAQETPFA